MTAATIAMGETVRSSDDAFRLFRPALEGSAYEIVQVAHLDAARRLIELTSSAGDPSSVALPIAAILRRAVVLGARGLMLAHNHPSGDPTPSAADIEVTRRLAGTARDLDLQVYDHLVFAGERWLSFRMLGLM